MLHMDVFHFLLWGGKSLSRIPSFLSGDTKKHCGPQWPFKKSSARHIQSGAAHPQRAQLGTPAKKALTVSFHVSKKRTKFTGAFRRFLGTTTKICQGFFISQTPKNASFALWKNWQLATGKSPCSNRKYHPTHSGSIFQPARGIRQVMRWSFKKTLLPKLTGLYPRSKQTSKLPTKGFRLIRKLTRKYVKMAVSLTRGSS